MSRKLPIIALILVTCLPALGLAHGHHHRHHFCGDCDCRHGDHCWDRWPGSSFETIELGGEIEELIYLPGSSPVELLLGAERGKILVRLAPAAYLADHKLSLREGQNVTVNGFWVQTAEDDLLVATEVQSEGSLVSLRDRRGRPLWR
jgi:hypothetical protein